MSPKDGIVLVVGFRKGYLSRRRHSVTNRREVGVEEGEKGRSDRNRCNRKDEEEFLLVRSPGSVNKKGSPTRRD